MKKTVINLLANSHINTIVPVYLAQTIEPKYTRERIDTPDGDFIDLDWVNKDVTDKPTVVLFHGTEGNSLSHYSRRIMYHLEQSGWRGVVSHFRSCSGEPSRKFKVYHAGETEDIAWILEFISKRTTASLYASGVSLGGNALLKYLGESVNNPVTAAFALSVPFDLELCTQHMDQGFNKYVYVKHFLSTLLPKMKQCAEQFNFTYLDRKIETLDDFNNAYICQIFGFKDSLEYYQKASCLPYLKNINTPTMILQAENDPMIPIGTWPNKEQLSDKIRFIATKTGGHAGFIALTKNYKDALLKLPKFMLEYFGQVTSDNIQSQTIESIDDTAFFKEPA